jgi:hypothetical protein
LTELENEMVMRSYINLYSVSGHLVDKPIELKLKIIPLPQDDESDMERITRQLGEELNELDVNKVDFVVKEGIPKGAKGVGAELWGQLLVSLLASGGVAASLIGVLQARVRRDGHSIRISRKNEAGATEEIELTGSSKEGEEELIHWITRVSK